MGKIKILAKGTSPQAQAQARGKLFEKLMAEVLRHYGYSIDRIPNVNYSGMEIDIEGKAIATGIPIYAECKCYETEVESPKFQSFYGKYMAMWLRDKRCQGLFIALPGINSHAMGFYRDNCEGKTEITVKLFQEDQVLEAIFQTQNIVRQENIARTITEDIGIPGDWLLLYTDKGLFWIQYVIKLGGGIASHVALYDALGNTLSEKTITDYLTELYPELDAFEKIVFESFAAEQQSSKPDVEEIVEVRGSSECFEYQFPASPPYFVGRQSAMEELDAFVNKLIEKQTSSRGILFEANSGWGKSSVVLASVARLNEMGHFAVAIDSRSAASDKFVLLVVNYVLSKFRDFGGLLPDYEGPPSITGFEGAVKSLLGVGEVLSHNNKVLFIFLDQFENIFFLPDILKRISDLLLKLCDMRTNVVIGFSWKTDLIGLTSEFPYQLRDSIKDSSKPISLERFSEVETTALLDKLSEELRAPLRRDLIFFLSEFSQGYPWLLKKLCAHVKAQREAGVAQTDIANSLLNVEELFQEDLRGLSPEEDYTLRQIAKSAPISIPELGEELKHEVVQSLVHRRLVVSIGHRFDVYWDIFRDYLNSGRVPVQDNYILRVQVGSVLKAVKLLAESGGTLSTMHFQQEASLTEKSFYNVIRDLRLLGLVTIQSGSVIIYSALLAESKEFENSLRAYLRERLRRNRLVWQILEQLENKDLLKLDEMSDILARSCPYISATEKTWRTYARIFAIWMDFVDLAILDSKEITLARYKSGTEIRERRIPLVKRRGGITIPIIQYMPVEKAIIKLVEALKTDGRIDWSGFKRSTVAKSLATLEDLGFITRKPRSITVLPKAKEFVAYPDKRPVLFANGAIKLPSFAAFVEILKSHENTGRTISELGEELKGKLSANWKSNTAETIAKIMMNWARHTKLAPGVFAETKKGPRKGWKDKVKDKLPLFSNIDK